jgi:hypothetical protein
MSEEQTIAVYLSGSIKKGSADTRESFWTEVDMRDIESAFSPRRTVFLNPATRADDLSDFLSTFGRDLLQVFCSDAVLVDARDRRGIGVGAEMAFAKMHSIPVVAICPVGSHYNRGEFTFLGQRLEGWVHPFVFGLSDAIVETVADGARWLVDRFADGRRQPDTVIGPDRFMDAMQHYVSTQLTNDHEMARLVHTSERLESRLEAVRRGGSGGLRSV